MSETIMVSKTEHGHTFFSEVRMENGVYVWATNGRVPPNDAIVEYGIDRLPNFNKELHDLIRKDQNDSFLSDYYENMKNHSPSEEELYEMRAAFGTGVTVVNLVTGKKIKI